MNLQDLSARGTMRVRLIAIGLALLFGVVSLSLLAVLGCRPDPPTVPQITHSQVTEDVTPKIQNFCSRCHFFPPPDTFPRSAWKQEVDQGFSFHERFGTSQKDVPPVDAVVKYFEDRAPLELPPADVHYSSQPYQVRFEPTRLPDLAVPEAPAISNVNLVHLFDKTRFDILACNMRHRSEERRVGKE